MMLIFLHENLKFSLRNKYKLQIPNTIYIFFNFQDTFGLFSQYKSYKMGYKPRKYEEYLGHRSYILSFMKL